VVVPGVRTGIVPVARTLARATAAALGIVGSLGIVGAPGTLAVPVTDAEPAAPAGAPLDGGALVGTPPMCGTPDGTCAGWTGTVSESGGGIMPGARVNFGADPPLSPGTLARPTAPRAASSAGGALTGGVPYAGETGTEDSGVSAPPGGGASVSELACVSVID
jgi:hypothetical protein